MKNKIILQFYLGTALKNKKKTDLYPNIAIILSLFCLKVQIQHSSYEQFSSAS